MDKVIEHDITEKLQKRVLTNIWGIEGNLKTKFSSEHVYMWITLWISCEFNIIFWKTPRRFHRLTHDRNKIWYYTYLREQY